MLKLPLAFQFGVDDIGAAVFKAYPVREPPNRPRRTEKIPKLPGAVKRGGVVVKWTWGAACQYGKRQKGVLAFRPLHSKIIADFQRGLHVHFFRECQDAVGEDKKGCLFRNIQRKILFCGMATEHRLKGYNLSNIWITK